jgi:hypothetical protein
MGDSLFIRPKPLTPVYRTVNLLTDAKYKMAVFVIIQITLKRFLAHSVVV